MIMDYEKKYKEALGRARTFSQRWQGIEATDSELALQELKEIFPELQESEDERIRRKLINALKECGFTHFNEEFTVQEALAWLEKQGEKDSQVTLPTFTFDDILALQCCMKSFEKDEELYNQLQSLHDRVHDAYGLEKKGKESNYNPYKEVVKSISDMVEKYSQPISDLQDFYNNVKVKCKDAIEYDNMFPEKQDEQTIAKAEKKNFALSLIKYLDDNRIEGCMNLSSIECEDLENAVVNSDWQNVYNYMKKKLEKQGEQKETPCDKCKREQPHSCQDITELGRCAIEHEQKPVETDNPKFKVGDWIINNDKRIAVPIQILKIEKYGYVTLSGYTSFDKVKTDYHLWTIQDAKDGDVLVIESGRRNNECLFIFKDIACREVLEQCSYRTSDNTFSPTGSFIGYFDNIYHPATKEQHKQLFDAMHKAGYEWDAEKKELKKIEQKPVEWQEEQIKQKAKEIAWQISKHYDPNACKQEWCEMAAMDMVCWMLAQLKKGGNQ